MVPRGLLTHIRIITNYCIEKKPEVLEYNISEASGSSKPLSVSFHDLSPHSVLVILPNGVESKHIRNHQPDPSLTMMMW